MPQINPEIFKAYDIRGIYPDELNEEVAYRVGWALAKFLQDDIKAKPPLRIAVGQDMRIHSPFLAREVIRGLVDNGADVVDVGRVPTPAFYYAIAFQDLAGGIMVSASHNPKQYNGFKLSRQKALPIGRESGMDKIQQYTLLPEQPPAATRGSITTLEDITRDYVAQDLSYLNIGKIKRYKIAADPGNAMGALYLDELFQKIPAELIKINWELNGNMPVHEPNPIKPETLQQLQEVMKNEGADLGIATDGDGDRIGFLDENVELVRGDIITAVLAKAFLERYPGSKIGYEVRSSRIVKETIEAAGGIPVMMPGGYSLMKPIMLEQDVLLAGEYSMHYMFRENYYNESPVLVIAQLLYLMSTLEQPLSEIWRPYQRYYHSGEINFEIADKDQALARVKAKYTDGKLIELDGVSAYYPQWWFNLRQSNTEPVVRLVVEAADETVMREKVEELSKLVQSD